MNIREAILKAADSIQAEPNRYKFVSFGHPCGSPACALGWISQHAGLSGGVMCNNKAAEYLGYTDTLTFYIDMMELTEPGIEWHEAKWIRSAQGCASALRKYADKYHPETNHIPDNVLDIFKVAEAA